MTIHREISSQFLNHFLNKETSSFIFLSSFLHTEFISQGLQQFIFHTITQRSPINPIHGSNCLTLAIGFDRSSVVWKAKSNFCCCMHLLDWIKCTQIKFLMLYEKQIFDTDPQVLLSYE